MKNLYKIGDELYIVSNTENLSENCWIITSGRLVQVSHLLSDEVAKGFKVILTTNDLLIKDGVQAIPDEFLEWFMNNSSCEEVEVDKQKEILGEVAGTTYIDFNYKIIIPQEEQETLEPLEVPMPIQNKSISSWNKSNTSPKFDGEYLCYISCREECGNVHRYYKVVINSFNTWVINKNERVALWKDLPKNPFND